jgi:hypothetical protein
VWESERRKWKASYGIEKAEGPVRRTSLVSCIGERGEEQRKGGRCARRKSRQGRERGRTRTARQIGISLSGERGRENDIVRRVRLWESYLTLRTTCRHDSDSSLESCDRSHVTEFSYVFIADKLVQVMKEEVPCDTFTEGRNTLVERSQTE